MNKTVMCATAFLIITGSSLGFAKEEWKEHKSKYFVIYYKEAPKDFVRSVEKAAERYYDDISDNLGYTRYQRWTFDERVKIFIYDNADDYVVNSSGAYSWSHGVASPRNKTIRTFPSAHGFFDSTLPHELGHIIFREMVGLNAQVPLWFEEGVAMNQEQAKRYGAHDHVRKAMEEERFIPLQELGRPTNQTDQGQVELFYAEAASVINYLISEHGKERFVRFCKELKEGSPFEMVLHSVYYRFEDLVDLNEAWVNYLTK